MVDYLVYASVRDASCDASEIDKILASANRNNSSMNITGVLLYNKKRFIQYLEGSKETIEELYNKIKEDARHKSVTLFGINKRDSRIFPTWAMAGKDAESIEFKTQLSGEDKTVFEEILNGQNHSEDRAMKVIHKLFG